MARTKIFLQNIEADYVERKGWGGQSQRPGLQCATRAWVPVESARCLNARSDGTGAVNRMYRANVGCIKDSGPVESVL